MATVDQKRGVVPMQGTLSPVMMYQSTSTDGNQRISQSWNPCENLLRRVGLVLRQFLLPLYRTPMDPHFTVEQQLAKDTTSALSSVESASHHTQDLESIRQHFVIRDVEVQAPGAISQIFSLRVCESKESVYGKKFRLILFSFNGNAEKEEGTERRRWEPLTIKALSEGPLIVLKALKQRGIRIDSLITNSLGNVVLESFRDVKPDVIPHTIIINRGLTSIRKILNKHCPFPVNCILHRAAKASGWDANPEEALLHFLETNKGNGVQRKVVIIEAEKDHYFSQEGRFAADIHERIQETGAQVLRAGFYPPLVHPRAHHAVTLNHLVKNSATRVFANTIPLSVEESKPMSEVIAEGVFFHGDEEYHTCLSISGNDANLDVATARDGVPLLAAFAKESQKRMNETGHEERSA
ncbi:MAG: hypothetical protein KGZ39_05395 [Simkania sp.]|nr:hypothetical protein [Simkania sp.]